MIEPWDSTIEQELEMVEMQLQEHLLSEQPLLMQVTDYFNKSKGKRFRPMLVLLSGQLGEYRPEKLVPLATAIEILHMATLVHDDIIDRADARRGRETVHQKWGHGIGLLLGDFFYAKSMGILSRTVPTAMKEMALAVAAMVEGEVTEQQNIYNLDITEEQYYERIQKKTASLIRACCKVGGYVGGIRGKSLKALECYGEYLGMAFQIRDDYLDYYGKLAMTGKPVRNDFYQGVVTLPLIHYMREKKTSQQEKEGIQRLMRNMDARKEQEKEGLFHDMIRSGSLEYTMRIANQFLQKALLQLNFIQPSSTRERLRDMVEYVLVREK